MKFQAKGKNTAFFHGPEGGAGGGRRSDSIREGGDGDSRGGGAEKPGEMLISGLGGQGRAESQKVRIGISRDEWRRAYVTNR